MVIASCCGFLSFNQKEEIMGKQKVSYEDLAEALYNFTVDFTQLMANHELCNPKSSYRGIDKQHFIREWLLMMFWVMHHTVINCNKERLMSSILLNYFQATGLMEDKTSAAEEKKFIIERFGEYDQSFNPADGTQQFLLGGTIAKNIMNKDAMVRDSLIPTD
jgi:hypothetical protein